MEVNISESHVLGIQLRADQIPHLASVRKRTGEKHYTFRRNIRVYTNEDGTLPLELSGYFLVSELGDINQIKPDLCLVWLVTARELVEMLESAWNAPEDK